MFKNRKHKTLGGISGQSTVEYIVLVTAVIAVVILFVAPGKDGKSMFTVKMNSALGNATEGITDKGQVLAGSHDQNAEYKDPADAVKFDAASKDLFAK